MFHAKKYHAYHAVQARDVDMLLQEFKSKIKWSSKQKIIDIGCGPGDTTCNYLLPLIPRDAELLAIDMSETMIGLAKSQYWTDPRLNFEVLDVTKPKIVEKYESNFDTVFSFYCLNWIPDQQSAMKNMYSVLKSDGEILVILVVDCPNYPLHELLAASPKWSPYMENYRDTISPYRYSNDPVSDVRNLFQDVGFHIKNSSYAMKSYTFPTKEIFHKWMDGVNPFLKNIPQNVLDEYDRAWKKTLWDEKLCVLHETNEVTYEYSVITVFAEK
ncbi:juvenile hormone acid O-methyltransferase-like [Planococcus citri]|uniref:juvenile hormone acid O-methyltransferase-like n=1 Tax=Planococcus citri TaxID=170843 RepID=UPI0031F803C4